MKKKLFMICLGVLGVISSVSLMVTEAAAEYFDDYWQYVNQTVAGQYVQMPSKDLRYVASVHNWDGDLLSTDLFNNYGLMTHETAQKFRSLGSEDVVYIQSLEGLDAFTNLEYFRIYGLQGVTDFRPLSKLTKMTDLTLYDVRLDSLNFTKNLSSLEQLIIDSDMSKMGLLNLSNSEAEQYYNYGVPEKAVLTDLSPLSNLQNLEEIDLQIFNGEFEPISMKNGYRKYEVFEPITLSSQFGDISVSYSSEDSTFSNTDGILKWNAVPYGTESLNLSWTAETADGMARYNGSAAIPIIWK